MVIVFGYTGFIGGIGFGLLVDVFGMDKVKASTINRRKSVKSEHSASSSNSQSTITTSLVPVNLKHEPSSVKHEPSSVKNEASRRSSLLSPSKLSKPRSLNLNKEDLRFQDKLIKSLLKRYKKLEVDLTKFNSKQNGILKTNILRTTLLPFLRNSSLSNNLPNDSKIYTSLISISTTNLLKWWKSLLLSLSPSSRHQISSTDRNAYLECISRIIARKEWNHIDSEIYSHYQNLLIETLDFSLGKLQTLKMVPVSISAFVGKVFAYCFFHLPNVNNALLFLLNVKQTTFESIKTIPCDDLGSLYSCFPKSLHWLINFNGMNIPNDKKNFINCIPPPKHPVEGISDPNGSWVRRWCSSDSDVFNSFFRHYISIIQLKLSNFENLDSSILLNCPGFNVILSHIQQIFNVSITRISKNNSLNKIGSSNFPIPFNQNKKQPSQDDVYYDSIIKLLKTLRDVNYSNFFLNNELIKMIDDILINITKSINVYDYSKNSLVLNIFYEFVNHIFDNSIINWEFWLSCTYMMITNTDHVQTLLKNLAFLFNIWDMIPETLSLNYLNSNEPYLVWLKNPNHSFKTNFINWLISNEIWNKLFIHWHPIVRSYYIKLVIWRVIGINNFENSNSIQITKKIEMKLNLSHQNLKIYFNSNKQKLDFTPDNPLVNRKFGILPTNLKTELLIINDQSQEVSPAAFGKPSELRKSHPFEVFDEAIYSCSSLPAVNSSQSNIDSAPSSTPGSPEKIPRNNSFVNSIGKLFKMLSSDESSSTDIKQSPQKNRFSNRNSIYSKSNDDMSKLYPPSKNNFSLKNKRNSVSLTSLSTAYSNKSRSSSPSIMSYQSTPTSITDFSTDSSLSDSSSELSDQFNHTNSNKNEALNQPPELFKIPPEIIRPFYKFEIIIDNASINNKFQIMQITNSNMNKFVHSENHHNFPMRPKIPSVTIFLNADSYSKFYISTENILISNSNQYNEEEFEDVENFVNDFNSTFKQVIKWNNLGKSLNEWNSVIDEFEKYLVNKVEIDEFSYLQSTNDKSFDIINEREYFKKIIPFLPVDSINEFKLLNAG